jgi:TolB protein
MRPDGSDVTRVDLPHPAEDFGRVIWSHDGTRLLHSNLVILDPTTGDFIGFDGAISDADGSNFHRFGFAEHGADIFCSAWTPDDTAVLCAMTGEGGTGLVLASTDGVVQSQLTTNPFGAQDLAVGYSPDGGLIAFLRYQPGSPPPGPAGFRAEQVALYIVQPDGSGLRQVTPFGVLMPHEFATADWAPSGERLVSSTPHGSLVLIDVGTGAVSPIQLDLRGRRISAHMPTFSPSGTQIAFSGFDRGPANIYRANLDGTDVTQLTSTPPGDLSADWRAD